MGIGIGVLAERTILHLTVKTSPETVSKRWTVCHVLAPKLGNSIVVTLTLSNVCLEKTTGYFRRTCFFQLESLKNGDVTCITVNTVLNLEYGMGKGSVPGGLYSRP